ncbi:RNA-guided endonuclease InsQ/TnpB family protein [Staphylothermus hellenicus]|uniref:Transposase, IS605 OrfB family n=1 Tax=Staphylothermus hellenicus (strain DSM 12710 / JCM 10830 / BK20S6-10-b1 / P8) TaxID=591019 RepID=D7DAW7_STAHD|nr:RNA-guided endonuclease TnpB family protein [Staphylothermus hellenicus]ADI31314.1 transposase, IS605 OrfB family [Staphylothermus hellenicus DSM 12710]
MVEVTLTVPFKYEKSGEIRRLLVDFRDMVNFCIEKAVQSGVTSYARLRKLVYGEWKRRWDYSTHFCHSACRIASSMLKSWRRKTRRGEADPKKPPKAKKLFIRFDQQLVKFDGERLRISVKPRRFLYVKLRYGEYQRRFIEEWRRGNLRIGEITMNENKVIIPFKKEVDLTNPSDWIAIDINESNVTGVSSNPHILRIEHNLRTIHTTYYEIRRRIQKLSRYKPITSRRLLKKYSGREKRKTHDLCHKISKMIVDFAKKEGLGIIMEDLRGIRKRIKYNRNLNRRLHSWNFRKLQFMIEYKAKLNGIPVVYVNPRNTSRLCPICGGRLAPNGRRLLKCRKCGYINDRDIIACINMLRMRGVPVPPESLSMKFEGKNPMKMERGRLAVAKAIKVTANQNGGGS